MTTESERSEGKMPWSARLASMQEQSHKAFEELDPGDVDAAIELGTDICKELGICCTEKGKVMFQVFKRLREQKEKEAAAAAAAAPPADQPPGGKLEVLKEKAEEGGEESA